MHTTWTLRGAAVRHVVSAVVMAAIAFACSIANATDPKVRIFSGTDEHWVSLHTPITGLAAALPFSARVATRRPSS